MRELRRAVDAREAAAIMECDRCGADAQSLRVVWEAGGGFALVCEACP